MCSESNYALQVAEERLGPPTDKPEDRVVAKRDVSDPQSNGTTVLATRRQGLTAMRGRTGEDVFSASYSEIDRAWWLQRGLAKYWLHRIEGWPLFHVEIAPFMEIQELPSSIRTMASVLAPARAVSFLLFAWRLCSAFLEFIFRHEAAVIEIR